jgi:hypothetical protein
MKRYAMLDFQRRYGEWGTRKWAAGVLAEAGYTHVEFDGKSAPISDFVGSEPICDSGSDRNGENAEGG